MDLVLRQDEPTKDKRREGLYIHTTGNGAQVKTIMSRRPQSSWQVTHKDRKCRHLKREGRVNTKIKCKVTRINTKQ